MINFPTMLKNVWWRVVNSPCNLVPTHLHRHEQTNTLATKHSTRYLDTFEYTDHKRQIHTRTHGDTQRHTVCAACNAQTRILDSQFDSIIRTTLLRSSCFSVIALTGVAACLPSLSLTCLTTVVSSFSHRALLFLILLLLFSFQRLHSTRSFLEILRSFETSTHAERAPLFVTLDKHEHATYEQAYVTLSQSPRTRTLSVSPL